MYMYVYSSSPFDHTSNHTSHLPVVTGAAHATPVLASGDRWSERGERKTERDGDRHRQTERHVSYLTGTVYPIAPGDGGTTVAEVKGHSQ